MEFSSLRFVDVVVAAPVGRLDHSNAGYFHEALVPLLDEAAVDKTALVLDLAGVEYISSMGLRVVMIAAKQMRSDGARLAAAALQPIVSEIFDISRFNHVLAVYPSVRLALQQMSAAALAAYDSDATAASP